jgi:hypothetical protein
MRTFVPCLIAAAICSAGLCHAVRANEFPYTATVSTSAVLARSGPTYGAYPTERLAKFSQVEVHEEGANGWVAIRPLPGAFDWLPASAVNRLGSNLGQVTEEATPWIGSTVKKVDKHVSQVTLKPGERVQILGEKQVSRDDGTSETWLKIAPPAGEFRWVQSKFLSSKSPELLEQEETAERLAREERWRRESAAEGAGLLARIGRGEEPRLAAAPSPERTDRAAANAPDDSQIEQAQFFNRNRRPLLARRADARAARSQDDEEELEPLVIDRGEPSDSPEAESSDKTRSPRSRSVDIAREQPGERPSLDPRGAATDAASATPPPSVKRNPPIDAEHFEELLRQLEVDLTLMVAQDSSKWSLRSLRRRAEALVEDGPTPLDRGRARLVLDRIAQFESTLPPGQEEPIAFPTRLADSSTAPAAAPAKPEFETNYDAVGYLMPVLGTRPGLPPYQLTDKDGNTLQYISPAPGMNLNRYVKKQVGLYGQRGYLETLKKQHIIAERIVDLDRHRR